MTNKEIVIEFTEKVFNAHNLEHLGRYMHDDYVQHNPAVAQGKMGFANFCTTHFFAKFPNLKLHIKHIYAEEDIVVCHNLAVLKPGEIENIVVDIYRLKDGKLAEHWDCIQHLTPEQIEKRESFF